ncbi:unnamed protein product [Didymodactylos carnosus]|uniref:EIPR1-like beta-propeller domain-containing protein n=1 Tax=Didymodactylos carnosus TaxID=1234261 RepID=A0A813P1Q0_9BILA|nr:unnamed protein product [Didymodactylos carnosus]CAF0746336.1 unnamed protein product [Didymodactylos carnosus]CAF3515981.1 unnamed protein product [Didymodactylos carnosus]CAF3525165.1 unnamed protein product [Didymodactylos carnosus]
MDLNNEREQNRKKMDDEEAPMIYGVEFQARSLCAVAPTEDDTIRFLVGTQSLRFNNQVHYLEYDEENQSLSKSIYSHRAGEIWKLQAAPTDKNIFATIYNNVQDTSVVQKCSVWEIPQQTSAGGTTIDDSQIHQPLQKRFDLQIPNATPTNVVDVAWEPNNSSGDRMATINETNLTIWNIQQDAPEIVSTGTVDSKSSLKFYCCRWNPHQGTQQISTSIGPNIRGWDLRTMKVSYQIDSAHPPFVRDIDYNPNRQYYIMTCGDDCKVKFWDLRKTTECLKVLNEHSHWVWSARYNHFHDQLIVTSSSDTRVMLFNISSLSSEPYGSLASSNDVQDESDAKDTQIVPTDDEKEDDRLLKIYEEHEESVYLAEWSSNDPWLLASLSYDGRLILNRVPKNEKFKILLRCPT